jgi:hypothetical protein
MAEFLKHWVFIALIFFSAPTLAGPAIISDEELLIPEEASISPPEKVTAEQARYDISVLVRMLIEGYGGYSFLPDNQGPALVERFKTLAANLNDTSSKALCEKVAMEFAKIQDAHLEASLGGACIEVEARHLRKGRVGANVAPLYLKGYPRPWKLTRIRKNGKTIPILSITKFPSYFDKIWAGYESDIIAARSSGNSLIVDLRQNG